MPPSSQSSNVPSVNSHKIELKEKEQVDVKMTTLIADGYNLLNLGEGKNPVLPKWNERPSEFLAEAFNTENKRVSIRLGRQLNGRYMISIDFDVNDKAGNHQAIVDKLAEYKSNINRLDGMFSSSTTDNFNVLVDITDIPEYLDKVIAHPNNKWKWSGSLEVLAKEGAYQVIPPTVTINKVTGEMGNPRKFLNGIPVYKVTPEDTYMIHFLNEIYVAEKPKVVIKSAPVRPVIVDNEVDNEWTELLFKVIQNEARGNDWVIPYNKWMGIGTILKHNEYPFMIFKRWTMMCPLAKDDGRIEAYWESVKGSGFGIHALQGIAKDVNPIGYKIWLVKHKKYLSVKTLELGMNDVAKYMKDIMKEHCVYVGKDGWYRNTGSVWFHSDDAPLATITTQLQTMIDLSRETLLGKKNATVNEEEKKKMEEILVLYTKHYKQCGSAGYSVHISKLFKEYLLDADFPKKLNRNPYQMVYKDGIYDMRTKTFRPKIYPQEFISKTLPYEYERGCEATKGEIRKQIKRICNNNEEQYNYYMSAFGYALTGDASREQYLWYMCGESACNGKSSVLEAFTQILPIYVKDENREHIDKKDKMWHKAVAVWDGYRLIWVNEATEEDKNEALLKQICDATQINFPKLYGNSTTMPVSFKMFIVSNYQFKIRMENAIVRRFIHEQFNSKFDLDEKAGDVEDIKGLRFYKNKDFAKWLIENKHSFLELFYEYSYQYAQTQRLPQIPREWQSIKDDIVASQNTFEAEFYSECKVGDGFQCCKEDAERVLGMDSSEIKKEMKKLRIPHTYESQKKVKSVKGWHIGFRLKTQAEKDAEELAEELANEPENI